ncbi:hypothetical protein OAF64_07775 [Crocinitomicaceae bacterium]|nr:hypothetical protein [Crocinitomicaceae bacterium]
MNSKRHIVLYGRARGIASPLQEYSTGNMSIAHMKIESVDFYDLEEIDDFDFYKKEIGQYHRPKRVVNGVRVFIDDINYASRDLNNFILNNIEFTDKIYVDGYEQYKFIGDVYVKIRKTLPLKKELQKDKLFIDKIDFTEELNIKDSSKVDFGFDSSKTIAKEPIQQPTTPILSKDTKGCLGQLIFGLIGFVFLSWLFGGTGLFIPLLLMFGLSSLFGFLSNRRGFLNGFSARPSGYNLIGWALLFFALYYLYNYGFSWLKLLVLGIGLGLILGARSSNLIRGFGRLLSILCIGFLIYMFSDFNFNFDFDYFDDDKKEHAYDDDDEYVEDGFEIQEDSVINDDGTKESFKFLTHSLNWKDNKSKQYSGVFKVRKDLYHLSRLDRNKIEPSSSSFTSYYREVYQNLIRDNKGRLQEILETYSAIGSSQKLTRNQFADMVVTSIQNIPYYLVHDLSHKEADRQYGGFVSQYHRSGGPCLDNIKFGLQSPTEFMGNFKGDCDTRSVLLFYVLSKFGYKVMVLGSERYGHAILAVAGNFRGLYKRYNGVKYYAWETTATGFSAGSLSPECNNMSYWDIVLTN